MNDYIFEDEVFIWGIKSFDDLSDEPASLYTLNDIDLTYNGKTNLYSLGIETIFQFDDIKDEIRYITDLLDRFTDWMEECGYSTNYKLSYADVLNGVNSAQKFTSIEQAYAWFKFQVTSFVWAHDFD